MKVLELFGGIGACTKAFKRLGIPHKVVDYVEIDKYAVASYNAINGTNFEPQDICEWNKDIEVDLITHGSPCQDFSLAGKQAGGDKDSGTRSSLMYETIRIVEKLKPKYVIWENVKNLLSKKHIHNFNAYLETMEQLGYTNYYQVLNAKDYGIPQNRERVFTISIRKDINKVFTFPQKQELKLKLKDMLEEEVDEKYYLSDEILGKILFENKPETDELRRYYKIKNATKKGYQEAHDGDSVNLSYPDSKTRRGRVGKEVAQTLDTQCEQGVVVKNA
jgi:DNA (cytosine-5)-methyltransferase 1